MSILVKVILLKLTINQQWICAASSSGHISNTNGAFIARVFDGYSKHLLPVCDFNQPLVVNLSMYLVSIDHIDMKDKTATARTILALQWTDEHLRWNISDFKNLSKFSTESKSVWLPDLNIGNDEGLLTFVNPDDVRAVTVHHNGVIEAWPYLNFEVGVQLNIYEYPFDKQAIEFEFNSWLHDDSELDFVSFIYDTEKENPLRFYKQNGEWDLVSWERTRYPITYDNYTNNFTTIQYRFTIKRRWLYTIVNLVVPVVLTTSINTLSFLLPVDSGERISLSNTVFLTLAVFFTIINSSLPKTSEGVPIIVTYIGLQLIGSVLTIACTIWSVALYHSATINHLKVIKCLFAFRKPKKSHKDGMLNSDIPENTVLSRANENENVGKIASSYLDRACFWLSLVWNIVLLLTAFISIHI